MDSVTEEETPLVSSLWGISVDDQKRLILLLLAVGVVLFLFAGLIGTWLTTQRSGNSYSWSPDEAAKIAWTLRGLAAMSFLAGLVERLAFEISTLKNP